MANVLNHDDSITVTAYSLHEFVFEMMELAQKGFCPTLENNKIPTGGFGSYYTATVVPINSYRIGLDGTHLNTVDTNHETSQETALKDDSSDVSAIGGTDVSETANTAKTAVKRTPTKKTT